MMWICGLAWYGIALPVGWLVGLVVARGMSATLTVPSMS